jgi:hypothetical protein
MPSHGIDVSKNQFHTAFDFLQGIDSVESMPEIVKSLKIRAQASGLKCKDDVRLFLHLGYFLHAYNVSEAKGMLRLKGTVP